jgi:hypothetical protein
MTTNQEGVHAAVRAETSTTGTYLEDWHALFTADGVAAGPWNARMLAWINLTLSATYANLNEAMHAFAVDQGFNGWTDMNTLSLTPTVIDAGNPMGLLLILTYPATP